MYPMFQHDINPKITRNAVQEVAASQHKFIYFICPMSSSLSLNMLFLIGLDEALAVR